MQNLPSTLRSPLSLDLPPCEVAARLRHRAGLVFLDSATAGAGQVSIIGVEPERVWQGNDLRQLDNALSGRSDGAAIGYVSYEGDGCLGLYNDLLIHQHDTGQWFGSEALLGLLTSDPVPLKIDQLTFAPSVTESEYCENVERAKAWIASGDIYQVNVTHDFHARWNGEAFALFQALRHCSPAPYSAFLDLGGRQVISSSPESFLKMTGRQIVTRPIKGTRPRLHQMPLDALATYELTHSPKEAAELVMITDLERNDLGRVCEYGSVVVSELARLEMHPQVFHLVSTVEGTLRAEVSHAAALQACFPGGSITGAPKRRAMEIIRDLEQRARGIYTGAIGYFGSRGESEFSIAIRTLCQEGAQVSFAVGAGIVADSDPALEYQETLDKAAGILLAARELTAEAEQNRQPKKQVA